MDQNLKTKMYLSYINHRTSFFPKYLLQPVDSCFVLQQ